MVEIYKLLSSANMLGLGRATQTSGMDIHEARWNEIRWKLYDLGL